MKWHPMTETNGAYMDQDQINFLSSKRVAQRSYQIIDAIQGFTPGEQVAALAVVFFQLCDVKGVDIRQELERTGRFMKDADKRMRPEFDAMREYIKGEL